jgi:flagellar protein FlaG
MDEFKVGNPSLVPQLGRKVADGVRQKQSGEQESAAVADVAQKPVQSATEAVGQKAEQEQPQERQQVKEAVSKLNDYVQNVQRSLQFDFDEDAGKSVITVVDRDTKEVIRQIPDELALELARNLNSDESVSLFRTKV